MMTPLCRYSGLLALAFFLGPLSHKPIVRVSAQESSGRWTLSVQLAALGSRAENDRWYVTDEGYHVHPFSDAFAPGAEFGLAYEVSSKVQAGVGLLYGRAGLTLGIIDQNSSREPETEKSMGFLSLQFTPSLTIPTGESWSLVLGPTVGIGWMQEVRVDPPFGPSVTFGGGTQVAVGGTAGLDVSLGASPFSFRGRFVYLGLDLPLIEDGLGQEMSKPFGPMGILAGVSYSIR